RHTHSHTLPSVFFFLFFSLDGRVLPPCVIVEVVPCRMYCCHPAVPLAVLTCLLVLLFAASPAHTQMSISTVLCRNVFGNEGRWLTFRAEMMTRLHDVRHT
ncbi:hypothetical protein TcCL_NonESM09963, partial [Trypanosoma cruzi]